MRKLKTFGQWLHERRRAARMSQEELAKMAFCSKSYVSTLERGAVHSASGGSIRPSEEIVSAFAKALGVDENEARLVAGYAPLETKENEPEFDYDLRRLELEVPTEQRRFFRTTVREQARALAATLRAATL